MLKKKMMRLVLSMLMALVMLFQGVNFNVYAGMMGGSIRLIKC